MSSGRNVSRRRWETDLAAARGRGGRAGVLLVALGSLLLVGCDRTEVALPEPPASRPRPVDCRQLDSQRPDDELVDRFTRELAIDTDVQLFSTIDLDPALLCLDLESPRAGRVSVLGYAVVHRPHLETGLPELVRRGAGAEGALGLAARLGKARMAGALLTLGSSPDADQALLEAVAARDPRMVDLLLEAGADPDRPAEPSEHLGDDRPTALHIASANGDLVLVRSLLHARARTDVQDWMGRTALELAVDGRHRLVVDELLRAGALPVMLSVEAQDRLDRLLGR